jgi:Tfp pilus assembly protein PilF
MNFIKKLFSNKNSAQQKRQRIVYESNDAEDFAKTYYNLGQNMLSAKDYRGAILQFTKAIEINPKYDLAFYGRALAKKEIGDINGYINDKNLAARFDTSGLIRHL